MKKTNHRDRAAKKSKSFSSNKGVSNKAFVKSFWRKLDEGFRPDILGEHLRKAFGLPKLWMKERHSELSEASILQTVGFLRMEQECPTIREELAGTSSGRQRLALLDQWKALGCPPPAFGLANLPTEEVTLKLERFLDSLS